MVLLGGKVLNFHFPFGSEATSTKPLHNRPCQPPLDIEEEKERIQKQSAMGSINIIQKENANYQDLMMREAKAL